MKKIFLFILTILFIGCTFTHEDDDDIKMTMTRENDRMKVVKDSGNYLYNNPYYNFSLDYYDGELMFSKAYLKYNGKIDRIDNIEFYLKPSENKFFELELTQRLINEVIQKGEINLNIEFYFESTTSLSKIEKIFKNKLKITYEEKPTILEIIEIENIKNIIKEKDNYTIEDTVNMNIKLSSTSHNYIKLNQVKANGINVFTPKLILYSGDTKSIDLFLRDLITAEFLNEIEFSKYKTISLELEFVNDSNQTIELINTQVQFNFSEIIKEESIKDDTNNDENKVDENDEKDEDNLEENDNEDNDEDIDF